MNVQDLHWRSIVSIARERSPFQIEYQDQVTNELRFKDDENDSACRIIAPIRFTIIGEFKDELGQMHNYQHSRTLGSIHVNERGKWGWACIAFTDPDECRTYFVHDPIQIGSIPAPNFSTGRS